MGQEDNGPGREPLPIPLLHLTLHQKLRNKRPVGTSVLDFICLQVSCLLRTVILLADWTLL